MASTLHGTPARAHSRQYSSIQISLVVPLKETPNCKENTLPLQACVIYRDHYNGPSLLTAVNDFIGKEQLMSITDFLRGVRAIGNNDTCESVAAGLQVK